jgi:hypothetical protein
MVETRELVYNAAMNDLAAEQNALRFALGLPSEPVYLDIKPVTLLTAGERRPFAERLATVTNELASQIPRSPNALRLSHRLGR